MSGTEGILAHMLISFYVVLIHQNVDLVLVSAEKKVFYSLCDMRSCVCKGELEHCFIDFNLWYNEC